MPFRPLIPLVKVRTGGIFTKLTGVGDLNAPIDRIKNALIAGDFAEVASIVAQMNGAHIDILAAGRTDFVKLLEDVVYQVAKDGVFEQDEREYVQAFVKSVAIPKADSHAVYRTAVRRALVGIIDGAIADNRLSDDEFTKLNEVSKRFDMTEADWKQMYTAAASERVLQSVNGALDDGLLSDDEWAHTEWLAKQLRVGLNISVDSKADIEFARDRWRALNGKLEVIAAGGVNLKDDEAAYFDGECDWFELRTVARQVSYGGLTGSARIAKGVRFRYGSLRVTSPPVEAMQKIDSGRIILTSDRLIFMGAKANKTIRWQSALAVNILSANEFEVEKSSGKSPTLAVTSTPANRLYLASSIAAGLIGRKYC
ncbi:MAG: hypothetical protein J0L78_12480 [Planctomycetes bacterium]|nr:hypothetical protein [Planctomycetota bacterium]